MSVDNSLTNTKVVLMLIRVARAAFHAADDSEQVQAEDGLAHVVNSQDFDELSNALDALEELPDDQPGYIMHGPAKAEWALRALLAAAPQPVCDIKDAAPEMVKGGRYNWKDQKERLVYLGRNRSGNGFWHQFAKIEAPTVVWCEVVDADLHMIEKTPQPVCEPAENSFEWFQSEIQRLQQHVAATWPDWMKRTSGLSTATFPTVGAAEVKP